MAISQVPHRFGTLDAVFLNFERKEMPLNIGSVSICDGVIPFELFVAMIESRLDRIPRYRQKVMRPFLNVGMPTWQFDPDFDIRRHIFRVKLARPGGEAQLRKLTGRIFTELLDRNKPLWQVYIVEGLQGGRSAMISKVHHAMVDGVAGLALLNVLLDTSPEVPAEPPAAKPYDPPKPPDAASLFLDAIGGRITEAANRLINAQRDALNFGLSLLEEQQTFVGLQQTAAELPKVLAPLEQLPFNRPCSGERRVAWSEFATAEMRGIRAACGATINDIIVSVLAGAVARYLKLHHESAKNRLIRLLVPVNVRHQENDGMLGNRLSLLPMTVRLDIADPIERLRHVAAQSTAMKSARVAELIRMGASWLGAIPAPLQTLMGSVLILNTPLPLFHMVCTNVPGPQVPLYIAGKRMLSFYPHVPTGMDVGVSLAVESYDQKFYFALTIDAQAAPDGERMKGFLDASYTELRKAAGVPATEPARKPARRAPEPEPEPEVKQAAAAAAGD